MQSHNVNGHSRVPHARMCLTPLQAIELSDEDQQLNETAFELVQKLGM